MFNSIYASIQIALEDTREMIVELADLFRYLLQASQAEYVMLSEVLEFTRKYLALEKARLQERPVPPMLIQPLVENAVKHGIAPLIGGGAIRITATEQDGRIRICIEDTGPGVEDKQQLLGTGTGLTNTALRLEKMFGSSLQFTDTRPHGLTVNFIIA